MMGFSIGLAFWEVFTSTKRALSDGFCRVEYVELIKLLLFQSDLIPV